jgi:hypothetical protein
MGMGTNDQVDDQVDGVVQAVDAVAAPENPIGACEEEELEFLRNLRANLVAGLAKVNSTRDKRP